MVPFPVLGAAGSVGARTGAAVGGAAVGGAAVGGTAVGGAASLVGVGTTLVDVGSGVGSGVEVGRGVCVGVGIGVSVGATAVMVAVGIGVGGGAGLRDGKILGTTRMAISALHSNVPSPSPTSNIAHPHLQPGCAGGG